MGATWMAFTCRCVRWWVCCFWVRDVEWASNRAMEQWSNGYGRATPKARSRQPWSDLHRAATDGARRRLLPGLTAPQLNQQGGRGDSGMAEVTEG